MLVCIFHAFTAATESVVSESQQQKSAVGARRGGCCPITIHAVFTMEYRTSPDQYQILQYAHSLLANRDERDKLACEYSRRDVCSHGLACLLKILNRIHRRASAKQAEEGCQGVIIAMRTRFRGFQKRTAILLFRPCENEPTACPTSVGIIFLCLEQRHRKNRLGWYAPSVSNQLLLVNLRKASTEASPRASIDHGTRVLNFWSGCDLLIAAIPSDSRR
jgi:hypothetical protein